MMTKAASPFDNISLRDIPKVLPLLSVPEQEKLLAELEHLKKLKLKRSKEVYR